MFYGVHHAGIGVGDMEIALDFWDKKIGFSLIFALTTQVSSPVCLKSLKRIKQKPVS